MVGEDEAERFLAMALRLPELGPKEVRELTFTALPGVLPATGQPRDLLKGARMLYATTTPAEKRARLRERLASGDFLQFPGAFNPLSAKLIARHDFDGVYVSGAVLSADLGLPDIGLTTLTEVAARTRQIARVTELPVLADADTGFGEPMNVARTVQELEDSGLAALHIEDQVNPKRCGHLDGKQVVDEATAAQRVRAAVDARRDPNLLIVARTDIRAVDGLDAVIERAKRLVDAGADADVP